MKRNDADPLTRLPKSCTADRQYALWGVIGFPAGRRYGGFFLRRWMSPTVGSGKSLTESASIRHHLYAGYLAVAFMKRLGHVVHVLDEAGARLSEKNE